MSQAVSTVHCGVYRPDELIPKKYFYSAGQIDKFSVIGLPTSDLPVTEIRSGTPNLAQPRLTYAAGAAYL